MDDEIVFNQLKNKKNAIWSLMVAGGYLSIDGYRINTANYKKICQLKITNFEVMLMFRRMIMEWFDGKDDNYNDFIKSLIRGNLKEMNIYMNKVALSTLSYFDTGKKPSETTEPERFYHGFVLGLLVDLKGRYEVSSNRESGYGRYDVCLIPLTKNDPGIVIEFKVFEPNEENRLEDTVKSALKQIKDRNYDIVLLERGVEPERIFHYGFAFEGKKVLIG